MITIQGTCPSKSNSYRIIKLGQRYSLGKGKELKDFEKSFAQQFQAGEMIDYEFGIKIDVHYPSRRADLDNSLKVILDCLQRNGAIKNDNKCVEIIAHRFVSVENPRIEFELYKYE